jgi:hypothetical protein
VDTIDDTEQLVADEVIARLRNQFGGRSFELAFAAGRCGGEMETP